MAQKRASKRTTSISSKEREFEIPNKDHNFDLIDIKDQLLYHRYVLSQTEWESLLEAIQMDNPQKLHLGQNKIRKAIENAAVRARRKIREEHNRMVVLDNTI
jgi:folylpolyglutamate synthase/dihydropteroate synthase